MPAGEVSRRRSTSPIRFEGLVSQRGAAVITPYFKEPVSVLERCHQSCLGQQVPLRHVLVSDGCPSTAVDSWDADHIVLPHSHADNGNTPRCLGAISAINRGYWPILFLDADNWYRSWHLKSVLDLKARHPSADVLAMARDCVLPDGTPVGSMPDEDRMLKHLDTSCFVFYPSSFRALPLWGMMPVYLGPVCDRIVLSALKQLGLTIAGTTAPSVVFTAHYSWAYEAVGRAVPHDVHDIDWDAITDRYDKDEVFDRTGITASIIG